MAQIYWLLLFERSWSLTPTYRQVIIRRTTWNRRKWSSLERNIRVLSIQRRGRILAEFFVRFTFPRVESNLKNVEERNTLQFGFTPRSLVFFSLDQIYLSVGIMERRILKMWWRRDRRRPSIIETLSSGVSHSQLEKANQIYIFVQCPVTLVDSQFC